MNWNELLNSERIRASHSKSTDFRSEFQKDYHRIIVSSAFRRLQDKTQVFPLEKSDFIRTRLTHSLEVSSIAKTLGQNVCSRLNYLNINDLTPEHEANIIDILLSAGLLHDIGNPPFGHFGEVVIQKWFTENLELLDFKGLKLQDYLDAQMINDLKNFEGNAQSIRIVTKLHNLIDLNGMNLTKGLLSTLIKYPCNSTEIKKDNSIIYKKMGYFYAESETFNDIIFSTGLNGCRHPLTFLLEAADDIAYLTADIEDAAKKGIITVEKILLASKSYIDNFIGKETEIKYLTEAIEKLDFLYYKNMNHNDPQMFAMQNWIIHVQGLLMNSAVYSFTKHYDDIMCGNYQTDLFDDSFGKGLAGLLQSLAINNIFNNIQIQKLEIAAEKILGNLLTIFVPAAIKYDSDIKMSGFEKRVINLVSKSHMSVYKESSLNLDENKKLYLRLIMITDFISGMTDSYAKNLYKELNALD